MDLSFSMRDLGPWPGIKPGPPALGAESLSHWTPCEVPSSPFFTSLLHWHRNHIVETAESETKKTFAESQTSSLSLSHPESSPACLPSTRLLMDSPGWPMNCLWPQQNWVHISQMQNQTQTQTQLPLAGAGSMSWAAKKVPLLLP